MKTEVRLFATFREGRGKKVYLEIEEPTPSKILSELEIAESDVAILLVNGRDGDFDQNLVEGDYLSIFPPVGGG
ncbi:MAG: MoaD/ThiS family protein [Tissierellales bacterium]|jgi:molybdopterin converting factor small subunit|nr:MoaD/ThiS family protein [Tissierellales bacterium]